MPVSSHLYAWSKNWAGPGEKEKVRKWGAGAYDVVKKQAESLCIIGEQADAVELFLEGLVLASYRFEKYLSKDRKSKIQLKKVTTTCKKAMWHCKPYY